MTRKKTKNGIISRDAVNRAVTRVLKKAPKINKLKIPTRFKLLGQTITVEYDSQLFHKDDLHGYASYRTGRIVLQSPSIQMPIPDDIIMSTFFHELMHHILYMSGEDSFDPPLHKREFLVDRIAGMLNQAFSTMEYKDD